MHEWKDWEVEEKVEQEKWVSEGAACALFVTMEVSGGCAAAVFERVIAKVLS